MRIGLLTGGGDCPGLNAVIRARRPQGDRRLRRRADRLPRRLAGRARGLVRAAHDRVDAGDPARAAARSSEARGRTPTSARTASTWCARRSRAHALDGLIAIGGEDTLGVANRLNDDGLHVIGVPKTIDNDLGATDVTFGFDTALHVASEAIDRLHTTAESHNRILVVEVMGRHAGWIALHSGVAGGADVILIPEIPFDIDEVCRLIRRRHERGRYFSIVVAAEGAIPEGGDDDADDRRARRVRSSAARRHRPSARAGDRVADRATRRARPCSATSSAAARRRRSIACSRRGSGSRRSTPRTTGEWGMMTALRSTDIELVPLRRRGRSSCGPCRSRSTSATECCSVERAPAQSRSQERRFARFRGYAEQPVARSAPAPRRITVTATDTATALDKLCIDTIRTLSMDAVQKANSGHPGHADGARAARLRALHADDAPQPARSAAGPTATASCSRAGTPRCSSTRRCTSPATTSASRTTSSASASSARAPPATPSTAICPGIEVTTGPLGQGISHAVGMALGGADARRALQPARPRDRRSPHVRDRLRRRPRGGHLGRGLARSPATSGSAG